MGADASSSRGDRLRAVPEQISCDLGSELVVLNRADGRCYGVGAVGASVWRLLQEPRSREEILEALLEIYDVDADRCRADLAAVLGQLEAARLVESAAPGGAERPATGAPPGRRGPEADRVTFRPAVPDFAATSELVAVLRCARSAVHGEREPFSGQDLDLSNAGWLCLSELSDRHGVLPLVFWALRHRSGIPGPLLGPLADRHRMNALANLRLADELLHLVALFQGEGIDVIPYKGPILAQRLYGDVAMRQFGDLDLLIRSEEVLRARQLLASRGYEPRVDFGRSGDLTFLQFGCECSFERPSDGVTVELRWRILPSFQPFPLGFGELCSRLRTVALGGTRVAGLDPEDLALILCAHGAKHQWGRLGWLCDLARLILVETGIDWARVRRRARALGAERRLLLGTSLACDLLGASAPGLEAPAGVPSRPVRELAERVVSRMGREDGGAPADTDLAFAGFHLRCLERFTDRARYGWGLLTTPNAADRAAVALPRGLFPLYRLVHPIRLLGKRLPGFARGRDRGEGS